MKKENEADIPIFSLAFGRGADFDIVKRVAAQNNGFARKIYEDSDAALQIAGFYKEISTVLLKDVTFNYVDGTLYDTEVTNTEFKTYFRGSEMVVSGKVKDLKKITVRTNGKWDGNWQSRGRVSGASNEMYNSSMAPNTTVPSSNHCTCCNYQKPKHHGEAMGLHDY